MIDIIGNIKVDENNPDRVRYLLASIKSLEFLKEKGKFALFMEYPSRELCALVKGMLNECGFHYAFIPSQSYEKKFSKMDYGEIHRMMIALEGSNRYYLNFEEDHFCVLDDAEYMQRVIEVAAQTNTDLIKATFHEVETISAKYMYANADNWEIGKTWRQDPKRFTDYQHKWTRF